MSETEDRSGVASDAAPLSWDAFRHHRQAFLDRHTIAAMEEQFEMAPPEVDLDDADLTPDDDDDRGDWTLIGY